MSKRRWIDVGVFAAFALVIGGFVASIVLFALRGWDLDLVRPWSIVSVLWAYRGLPPYVEQLAVAAGAGGIAVVAMGVALIRSPKGSLFGDSRFARRGELAGARLLDAKGILLGRVGSRYLKNDEAYHTLVSAPTGSGKGVGFVIPNLLNWHASVVCLDVKGENFEITAGWRAKISHVRYWSPLSPRTHRYNPLDAVRTSPNERLTDLQELAALLVPAPYGGVPGMWENEARSLFVGIALLILADPRVPHTIGEVYRTLTTDQDLAEVIEGWLTERKGHLPAACIQSLGNYRHKAPKERSGVKSTLTAALMLWANPVVDTATSASDFRLEELRKKRLSIYVVMTVTQIDMARPLLNLFFQQAISFLARELPKEHEHGVLFLLDEFCSLGKMDILATALPFMRGYGVRMLNIVQNLGQLQDAYGRDAARNIIENSGLQVYFAPNDSQTSEYISQRLGTTTVKVTTRSRPLGLGAGIGSRNESPAKRELMLPQEVRALGEAEALLFKERCLPVKAQKIVYYSDRRFQARRLEAPSIPFQRLINAGVRVFQIHNDPAISRRIIEVGEELASLIR